MHRHTTRADYGRPGAEPAEAGGAAPESAPAAGAEGYEAVQHLLQRAVTHGGLPGILAEVRDGGRQWFGTAGVADTRTGRRRSRQDRFRIGSITKTFVATVVMQLAAERQAEPGRHRGTVAAGRGPRPSPRRCRGDRQDAAQPHQRDLQLHR
ncbi:serine hydrolase [Streptomyces sp. NPDC006512]|uniref:serine hydrolase n=1 Tax=Streptomyces sp. NPDC006512 TaxID=3154307 RepID=UPI00339EF977